MFSSGLMIKDVSTNWTWVAEQCGQRVGTSAKNQLIRPF